MGYLVIVMVIVTGLYVYVTDSLIEESIVNAIDYH